MGDIDTRSWGVFCLERVFGKNGSYWLSASSALLANLEFPGVVLEVIIKAKTSLRSNYADEQQ